MFGNRVLRVYYECFKCHLGCSFSVIWCVQIKSMARNRVAGTLWCACAGQGWSHQCLWAQPRAHLVGIGSQWHLLLPCRTTARLGFPEWEAESRLQVKWWERSTAVGVAEKGSPRNVSWVQSCLWKHQFLVVWDHEWFPFTDLLLWRINGHQLWLVEPLISFNHANTCKTPPCASSSLLWLSDKYLSWTFSGMTSNPEAVL